MSVTTIHSGIDNPATLLGRVFTILADAIDWMDIDEIRDASLHRWERRDGGPDIHDAISELLDMGYDIEGRVLPDVMAHEYRMATGGTAA